VCVCGVCMSVLCMYVIGCGCGRGCDGCVCMWCVYVCALYVCDWVWVWERVRRVCVCMWCVHVFAVYVYDWVWVWERVRRISTSSNGDTSTAARCVFVLCVWM